MIKEYFSFETTSWCFDSHIGMWESILHFGFCNFKQHPQHHLLFLQNGVDLYSMYAIGACAMSYDVTSQWSNNDSLNRACAITIIIPQLAVDVLHKLCESRNKIKSIKEIQYSSNLIAGLTIYKCSGTNVNIKS